MYIRVRSEGLDHLLQGEDQTKDEFDLFTSIWFERVVLSCPFVVVQAAARCVEDIDVVDHIWRSGFDRKNRNKKRYKTMMRRGRKTGRIAGIWGSTTGYFSFSFGFHTIQWNILMFSFFQGLEPFSFLCRKNSYYSVFDPQIYSFIYSFYWQRFFKTMLWNKS